MTTRQQRRAAERAEAKARKQQQARWGKSYRPIAGGMLWTGEWQMYPDGRMEARAWGEEEWTQMDRKEEGE